MKLNEEFVRLPVIDPLGPVVFAFGQVGVELGVVIERILFHIGGDGVGTVFIFKRSINEPDQFDVIGTVVTTNLPDNEQLALSFGVQNGEAVAKTMTIDYLSVAQER